MLTAQRCLTLRPQREHGNVQWIVQNYPHRQKLDKFCHRVELFYLAHKWSLLTQISTMKVIGLIWMETLMIELAKLKICAERDDSYVGKDQNNGLLMMK